MRLLALLTAAAVGPTTHTRPAQAVSAQLHGHYVPNRDAAGGPNWARTSMYREKIHLFDSSSTVPILN
jgi:hypothetical protein